MSEQQIGTIAICIAMLLAWLHKPVRQSGDQPNSGASKMTWIAILILVCVALVDIRLWLFNQQTFTAYIQQVTSGYGFLLGFAIFVAYWWKHGSKEALDVALGILIGHFWW